MNLNRILTMIMSGGRGERLEPLTRDRAKPAVPFGGIYRIIDFTLSNCINSGLRRAVLLTQYKSESLDRHIRGGWQFLPGPLGEYIECRPPQQRVGEHWYLGTADAVFQNLYSVRHENPEHVLILAGDHIYKMDYRLMLALHEQRGADLTVGAVEVPRSTAQGYGIIEADADARITGFLEKPKDPPAIPGLPGMCFASMGIYAFRAPALIEALEADSADDSSQHDFGKNILPRLVAAKRPVFAYNFVDQNRKEAKYWRDVGTLDAFYAANMDLVSVNPVLNLYDASWPIRTYQVQAPPPKFVFAQEMPGGRVGLALDSLVSQGCIVSGGRVQNSILSPNVRINSYALVQDSILFEGVQVGRYARVRRAVIDKDVRIPEGMQIGYDPAEDRKRFFVTESGIVAISKGEVIA